MDSVWLTGARWWLGPVVGVLVGLVVGVGVGGFTPWVLALCCGVLVGGLAGGLVDHHARTQREQVRAAVGALPMAVQVAGYRATRRGPVPSESDVVDAAVRIARYQLALAPERKALYLWMPLCFLPVPAVLASAVGGDVFAPVFAVLGGMSVLCVVAAVAQVVWLPRRLRERLRLLGVDEGVERAGAGRLGS
ncbi:hypothetical protein GCM10027269_18230 [Kribbella endophytica]